MSVDVEILRVCGVVGIAGSFTIMVCDWLGWTRPASVRDQKLDLSELNVPFRSVFGGGSLGITDQRLWIACIIGGFAMFPASIGFIPVFAALAVMDVIWALVAALCLTGTLFFGVIGHTMMGFINELTRSYDRAGGEVRQELGRLSERAIWYWTPLLFIGVIVLMGIGSLVFSVMVFSGETAFPAWMGLVNLFVLCHGTRLIVPYLPFHIRRWVGPAHVHIFCHLPFFILVTVFTWNGVSS